jgi:hypothetical protein
VLLLLLLLLNKPLFPGQRRVTHLVNIYHRIGQQCGFGGLLGAQSQRRKRYSENLILRHHNVEFGRFCITHHNNEIWRSHHNVENLVCGFFTKKNFETFKIRLQKSLQNSKRPSNKIVEAPSSICTVGFLLDLNHIYVAKSKDFQ